MTKDTLTYVKKDAQMHSAELWLPQTDPIHLTQLIAPCLSKAGFQVVDFTEFHFPTQGYTCIWLLAESHLAVHTFPEQGKSYIQISSCNKEKLQKLLALL